MMREEPQPSQESFPRAWTWSTYSRRVGGDGISPRSRRFRSVSGHSRQILTVDGEQIERVEVGPLAPEQQALEVAAPSRVQADDLSVYHGVVRSDRVRQFLTELRPVFEGVPVARHEVAVVSVSMWARARKPSCFTSKSQSGWSNGSGRRRSGMGRRVAAVRRRTRG